MNTYETANEPSHFDKTHAVMQLVSGYDFSHHSDRFLQYLQKKNNLWAVAREENRTMRRKEIVRNGQVLLETCILQKAAENQGREHCIRLSAGLDSNAILGVLSKAADTSSLSAITVGNPGELDFDLPTRIAKEAGIRHFSFDFSICDWSVDALVKSAQMIGLPAPLPVGRRHLHITAMLKLGSGFAYWDGQAAPFCWQSPRGWHELSWEDVAAILCGRKSFHRITARCPDLLDGIGFEEVRSMLPEKPWLEKQAIELWDQGQLLVRQPNFIAPMRQVKGFEIVAPLYDDRLLSFALSVPTSVRVSGDFKREVFAPLAVKGVSLAVIKQVIQAKNIAMKLNSRFQRKDDTAYAQAQFGVGALHEHSVFRRLFDDCMAILVSEDLFSRTAMNSARDRFLRGALDAWIFQRLVSIGINAIAIEQENRGY